METETLNAFLSSWSRDCIPGSLLAWTSEWPGLPVLWAQAGVYYRCSIFGIFILLRKIRNTEKTHAWLGSQQCILQQWEEGNYTQSKAWETFDKLSLESLFHAFTLCHLVSGIQSHQKHLSLSQGSKGQGLERIGALDSEVISYLLPSDTEQTIFSPYIHRLHMCKVCNNTYLLELWCSDFLSCLPLLIRHSH